jgi:alginate O-acetyltransferase complex protein AlgI
MAAARHVYAGLVGRHGIASISLGVHFALHPGVLLPLAIGCLLAVLPRWLRAPTLPRFVAAPLDTAWVFGLLILAMVFVGAGTYSPFLYFRF